MAYLHIMLVFKMWRWNFTRWNWFILFHSSFTFALWNIRIYLLELRMRIDLDNFRNCRWSSWYMLRWQKILLLFLFDWWELWTSRGNFYFICLVSLSWRLAIIDRFGLILCCSLIIFDWFGLIFRYSLVAHW